MKKVPFIEQMEHSECGMACLAMVFNYYGHHINLTELREEFGIPRGGLNFSQISQIANMKNMSTRGLRIDDSDFTQIKLPAILYWNEKHFVILEKISKNTFHIVDPAIGKIKLKREDFIKSYSNVLLELYPNEDFEKKKKVNSYRFFWQYILKHPKFLICILVSSILLQVLGIILPLLTKYITDNILIPGKVNTLNIVGIGIICILVSYQVTIFLRGYLIAKLQTAIDKDMMVNFIDHMFNLPFKFFENRSSGDLLFRANSNTFI
ncbi:cysteine peptidase family C39 domain-containing protein, partial [Bacillus thuringiensis]